MGVRQKTHTVALGLGYHTQPGLRTDKSLCSLSWDPGGNLNPFLRVVAISSESDPLFEINPFYTIRVLAHIL